MVDAERLRRILQRVADDVTTLRSYRDSEGMLSDPARLGHAKYLFVTALEGCMDAAQHVCASEGWGPPETNADAMAVLGRHGALDEHLTAAMMEAVRFRNLLVHVYARMEDRRVIEALDHLDDLEGFVAAVGRLAS